MKGFVVCVFLLSGAIVRADVVSSADSAHEWQGEASTKPAGQTQIYRVDPEMIFKGEHPGSRRSTQKKESGYPFFKTAFFAVAVFGAWRLFVMMFL